jgi:nucleotide-binding universal stress UspA family protein
MGAATGKILVGVDGSANSSAALRWAVAEAELQRARVMAFFAWGYVPPGHAGGGHVFTADYTAAAAKAALAEAIDDAVGAQIAKGIERHVTCELPPKALLSAASAADLLAIGARGVGGFLGLMLGSVSQACLHHTTVPLAIIRAPDAGPGGAPEAGAAPPTAGGRIVVGVDGSESARRALQWAVAEARRREASVDVVHGWQVPFAVPSPLAGLPLDDDFLEKEARAELDRIIEGAGEVDQPVPVEGLLVRGGAARAVLDAAQGADLVVLGTRGLGGFRGLLLGSVTHQVAHHVGCPMVVVP